MTTSATTVAEPDANGCLLCADEPVYPLLGASGPALVDSSIVVYGPAGSGKTTIARALVRELVDAVDQIIVYTSSTLSEAEYAEFGVRATRRRFDADTIVAELEYFWGRQESLAELADASRTLIVFDDWPAGHGFARTDVARKLFRQNRAYHVTAIVCVFGPTDVPSNLRKDVGFSIFAGWYACEQYFKHRPDSRERALSIAADVCIGFRALVLARSTEPDGLFYHLLTNTKAPLA